MVRMLVAAALAASMVAPAAGATEHVITSAAYLYVLPDLTIAEGDSLSLHNLDREVHTLTAVAFGSSGEPLFDTPFSGVGFLEQARVARVEDLAPGSYEYFCLRHLNIPTMRGVLRVDGSGS